MIIVVSIDWLIDFIIALLALISPLRLSHRGALKFDTEMARWSVDQWSVELDQQ